jgi:hypothetical protein
MENTSGAPLRLFFMPVLFMQYRAGLYSREMQELIIEGVQIMMQTATTGVPIP